MLKVRKAEPGQTGGVVACLSRLHFDDHEPFDQGSVSTLIASEAVYVAVETSEPEDAGVRGAMILTEEHGSYRIRALASRPGYRGAGKALVEHAIRTCEREGVPKLWCWSLDLYETKEFYQKLGFTEVHRLEKQFFGRDCWFFGCLIETTGRQTEGES